MQPLILRLELNGQPLRWIPWQEAIDVDLERARAEIPPFAGNSEGPFAPHDGNGDGPTGGDTSGPNPDATVVGEVIAMGAKRVWDELDFTGAGVIVAVIDSGVDVVILATPPVFRPEHLKYAIDNDKHVFCEKPIAVDAAGDG